jgi:maltose alpha-D-glucosyltransferase/alpha-amylase
MSKNTPEWLERTVFYEIYPQSFYDTNADGIGDINGIIAKLDYVKELGCDAIWLNPWYDSPFQDAGYDIRNFYMVAPRYGTNEDAKRLFEEAKKRGIRVCLDLVAGHTSMDCEWFQKSCETEPNEYSNRYIWSPWLCWRGDPKDHEDYYVSGWCPRGSYKASFFAIQPALNFGYAETKFFWEMPIDHPDCQATLAEIVKILRFWLDMGCSGFRVDMAPSLIKRDKDRIKTQELWRGIRSMFDSDYPDAVLISEWFIPSESLNCGFHMDFAMMHYCDYLTRDDSCWTMPIYQKQYKPIFRREGGGDITMFVENYLKDYYATKDNGYMCFVSGNHDVNRLRKYYTDEEMKVIFAFLLTMPGVPFIYYGDEIGMRYIEGLQSKEGGDTRTGSRTPMQWSDGKNLGFSDGKSDDLYLPVDSLSDAPTVDSQIKDNESLYSEVKRLVELRKQHKALCADGEFIPVYAEKDQYPFVYMREIDGERVLILINSTDTEYSLTVDVKADDVTELMSKGCEACIKDGKVTFSAQGVSYGIFKVG